MNKPHKKLDAWNAGIELIIAVYELTSRFPIDEKFTLTGQIRRASLSVPSNIAEGAARKTRKEFTQYLHMAQASLSELDTHLEVAKRLKYVEQDEWARLDGHIERIDKMLSGLIRHLRNDRRQNEGSVLNASRLTPHA